MKNSVPVELLAPAGGWPQLRAALQAGADAVFFGAGHLNMRSRAKNFSLEELPEVMACCREAGARGYLTLNTLIYESDLEELARVVDAAAAANVDAVIAADFAVITAASERGLTVHLSTQMSASNSASLQFFQNLGISRVVLARECTLEDLKQMRQHPQLQSLKLEVFGHGALCVAVSGRCFMSGFESGRSANRGECTQPCRREYEIQSPRGGEGFQLTRHHVMSPKDLCILPFLEQLIEAGIAAIKIEGRNRSPDYVHTVVSVYRRALDAYALGSDADFEMAKTEGLEKLSKVYNRGFSEGFYMGRPTGDWTTPPGNQSSHKRDYIGQILQMDPDGTRVTVRLESAGLWEGQTVFLESPDLGFLEVKTEGMQQEGKPIGSAEKGSLITLPRKPYMHKGLKLYQLIER